MRSSLTLLAALGAALAVAGVGNGAGGDRPGPGLDPNIALEIRAAHPAQTLPDALRTFAAETPSAAVSRAIRAGLAAPSQTGLELERLLAPFSAVVLSVEPSCPPPALLACRPAIRLTGDVRAQSQRPRGSEIVHVLLAELRAAGLEDLHSRRAPGGELAGRISSHGETLARWRLREGVLKLATGGLALEPDGADPPRAAPNSSPTVHIYATPDLLASLAGK